jgi:hypothetical protein
MGAIDITLNTAPLPAKASDEVEKIRAELHAALDALKKQTVLYEQLFAKMTEKENQKEKGNPNFPPLPTVFQPTPRRNGKDSAANNPKGKQPCETTEFTFRAPSIPPKATPATWADKAKAKTKANPRPKVNTSPARKLAASVRMFEEDTGPSGFTYIYLNRNRRMSRSEARSHLRRMGLEPSRLLDISMPTRKVMGLLVHVQYAPKVREILKKHGLKSIDFDPTDPSHIADPKHATLAADDRQQLAKSINANRLLRTLHHMRPEVTTTVGRYFVDQQWLTPEQLDTTLAHRSVAVFLPDSPEQTSNNRRKKRAISISSDKSNEDLSMTQ